jgi:hypothetical protein
VSLEGLLEPVARKRAWPVLRGRGRGNASPLPDEIYFSVVQRKVVSPNDFTDLAEVQQRLTDFQKRYNATAKPFQWKFTRDDLHDLLARIAEHEHQDAHAELPRAA